MAEKGSGASRRTSRPRRPRPVLNEEPLLNDEPGTESGGKHGVQPPRAAIEEAFEEAAAARADFEDRGDDFGFEPDGDVPPRPSAPRASRGRAASQRDRREEDTVEPTRSESRAPAGEAGDEPPRATRGPRRSARPAVTEDADATTSRVSSTDLEADDRLPAGDRTASGAEGSRRDDAAGDNVETLDDRPRRGRGRGTPDRRRGRSTDDQSLDRGADSRESEPGNDREESSQEADLNDDFSRDVMDDQGHHGTDTLDGGPIDGDSIDGDSGALDDPNRRRRRRRRRRGRGGVGELNQPGGPGQRGPGPRGWSNQNQQPNGRRPGPSGGPRQQQSGGPRQPQLNGPRQPTRGGINQRGGRRDQQRDMPRDQRRRDGGPRDQSRDYAPRDPAGRHSAAPRGPEVVSPVSGLLELHPKGYGFLRDPKAGYVSQETDAFVSSTLIEKCGLREGVMIDGEMVAGQRGQGPRLKSIATIDGRTVEDYQQVKLFDELTPINPREQIRLETGPTPITMRVMDLLCPIGKGQRALLVAPPRSGKTMLLQEIADAVSRNHPEIYLIVLLIDERPEEVTEMKRRVHGEVIASSMDREVESHVRVSQLIFERAKRLAESGRDVFLLLDSITRTARAFNKWVSNSHRTMSGGLDVKAMDIPKKMFGSARAFEEGGSLTVGGTALVDTGSKMDEVIFQEFKGTGNMEMVLSRDLADRRIWPAIDISKSGTRREELLHNKEVMDSIIMLRRSLISLSPVEAMEQLTRILVKYKSNAEFLAKVRSVL